MKIKQHPNGYYYAHPVGARPFSLKTKSKEAAARVVREGGLDKAEEARRLGLLTAESFQRLTVGKRVTVDQAIQQFIEHMPLADYTSVSVAHMDRSLRAWARNTCLENFPISSIERRHLDPWINNSGDQKFTTRVRNLSDLRVFLDFCVARGLCTHNPARQVNVRTEALTQAQRLPTERLPFTEAEVEKILGALEPGEFWHVAVLLSLDTGLRLRDIVLLEKISVVGKKLTVAASKGGAGRNPIVRHTLSDRTLQSLKAVPDTEGLYFFRDQALSLRKDATKEVSKLSQQFRRLCISLGIEGKSFHGMRHTFAMRREREKRISIFQQMAAELALAGVQADLGHASSKTTKVYLAHPKP